jgi:hypothetical protein
MTITAIGTICDCCPSHSLSRSQSDIPLPQLGIISLFIGGVLRARCLCAIHTHIMHSGERQRKQQRQWNARGRLTIINRCEKHAAETIRRRHRFSQILSLALFSVRLSCAAGAPKAQNSLASCPKRLMLLLPLRLPSPPLLLQWRWFVQLSCRVNY